MKPEETELSKGRRDFLMKLSIGLGSLAAVAASIPVLGALFEPLLRQHQYAWRNVGRAVDYKVGDAKLVKFENAGAKSWSGPTAYTAAWLRRDQEDKFIAFSANCTHLGCPVRWEQDAELFMCPCHGGVYYKDGTVAAGPPPKSLTQYEVRVKDGNIQVKTAPVPITSITA